MPIIYLLELIENRNGTKYEIEFLAELIVFVRIIWKKKRNEGERENYTN